jgi:hypothetical protein
MYGIHIINERNFIVACAYLNEEELYTKRYSIHLLSYEFLKRG